MTKVREIYEFMDSFAPFGSALDFDNVGLLVGGGEREVEKALVALDITHQVVAQAIAFGAQLIVSHHPVIFHPLKSLRPNEVPYLLAKAEIAAICAHTNLDLSEEFGVNRCLAETIGIDNLRGMDRLPESGVPQWFLGELPRKLSAEAFAALVREKLSAGSVRYTNGGGTVKTVGLLSGAGGDFLENASKAGADAFLSGEIGHHEFLLADALGIAAVEAGHFDTEIVVVKPLCEKLAARFPNVTFKTADEKPPVCFL